MKSAIPTRTCFIVFLMPFFNVSLFICLTQIRVFKYVFFLFILSGAPAAQNQTTNPGAGNGQVGKQGT